VSEAGRLRERVENHGRVYTQVLFLRKSRELGFFSLFRNSDRLAGTFRWSEDPSTAWLVASTTERSSLLKTGFFRQVRELKIQRKNPGSAFTKMEHLPGSSRGIGFFSNTPQISGGKKYLSNMPSNYTQKIR
jgi:hypothetical protein